MDAPIYLDHTPVDSHILNGRTVFVKREDLYASPPAPPLAKLRGLRVLLSRLCQAGASVVGCYQTRVSNIGHGLAAACLEFPSLKCIVVAPKTKHYADPTSIEVAQRLGAAVAFVPANRLSINYAQAERIVRKDGGVMLPFGMECQEAVEAVAVEAATISQQLIREATVIVSCGSGVTLAGLLKGFPDAPRRIVGVSSGRSVSQIERCVIRHIGRIPSNVSIYAPLIPYHEAPSAYCPFPCHPNYDLKAWEHLRCHLDKYEDPILFWNVGG